ncbi:MAG: GlsB/YeaQ/YmgE family stress response membrane protein [Planctomycetales bacterium]
MVTLTAIVVWIVFGIVAGGIARILLPGRQPMGWLATMSLGIIGSFAGGFIGYLLYGGDPMQPSGLLMSILGAVIVLALMVSSRGRPRAV